jgi:hypothetical protein
VASIEFEGEISDDGEHFCFDKVDEKTLAKVDLDPNAYFYPDTIFRFMKCEQDKRYKFTITAEPVDV